MKRICLKKTIFENDMALYKRHWGMSLGLVGLTHSTSDN